MDENDRFGGDDCAIISITLFAQSKNFNEADRQAVSLEFRNSFEKIEGGPRTCLAFAWNSSAQFAYLYLPAIYLNLELVFVFYILYINQLFFIFPPFFLIDRSTQREILIEIIYSEKKKDLTDWNWNKYFYKTHYYKRNSAIQLFGYNLFHNKCKYLKVEGDDNSDVIESYM